MVADGALNQLPPRFAPANRSGRRWTRTATSCRWLRWRRRATDVVHRGRARDDLDRRQDVFAMPTPREPVVSKMVRRSAHEHSQYRALRADCDCRHLTVELGRAHQRVHHRLRRVARLARLARLNRTAGRCDRPGSSQARCQQDHENQPTYQRCLTRTSHDTMCVLRFILSSGRVPGSSVEASRQPRLVCEHARGIE